MSNFNPDEYLEEKKSNFDPDEYLNTSVINMPEEVFEGPALPPTKEQRMKNIEEGVAQLPGFAKSVASFGLNAGDYLIPGGIENFTKHLYDEDKSKEIARALELLSMSNKGSAALGAVAGSIRNPLNMAIGGFSNFLGHASELLPKGVNAAKYASKVLFPGAAYMAAMPGEQSATEMAGGAGVNALMHAFPAAGTAMMFGSQALPAILDSGKETDWKETALGALGGLGLSAVAPSVMPQSIKEKLMTSGQMKQPLEFLERGYKEIGEKIEPERRGEPIAFKPAAGAPYSDNLKSLYDNVDTVSIKTSPDIPVAEKTILLEELPKLGDVRFKSLREVKSNPVDLDKVLGLIDKLNKSKGIKEDALETLNKQIEVLEKTKPSKKYDPNNENISAYIIGRAMQTPYRHMQALANALSYRGKEKLAQNELEYYLKTLELNQDVKSGKLDKWLTDPEGESSQTEQIMRYFRDGQQLTNSQIEDLKLKGVKMYPNKKDLIAELAEARKKGLTNYKTDKKLYEEQKDILEQNRDKLKNQQFNPMTGKLENVPQSAMQLKIDLNSMKGESAFKKMTEMDLPKKDQAELYRQYRMNPDKMNREMEILKEKGLEDKDIAKLLANRTSYLDDFIYNEQKAERDAAYNEKVSAENERREAANRQKYEERVKRITERNEERTRKFNERVAAKEGKKAQKEALAAEIAEIEKKREAEIEPYMKILHDMYEGKRQLGIESPQTTRDKIVNNFPVLGEFPSYMKDILENLTKEGKLRNMSKDETYYRDLYGKGKVKERTGEITPQEKTMRLLAKLNLTEEELKQAMTMLGDIGISGEQPKEEDSLGSRTKRYIKSLLVKD